MPTGWGELAGHYYFRDFYYSDSGLLAALLVLRVVKKRVVKKLKEKGISFAQIIKRISSYANTGEVNFKIEKKQEAMDAVKDYFMENEPPQSFLDVDGYRLDFEDWWFNIRPSNTEPYLRFLAEAKSKELLEKNFRLRQIHFLIIQSIKSGYVWLLMEVQRLIRLL